MICNMWWIRGLGWLNHEKRSHECDMMENWNVKSHVKLTSKLCRGTNSSVRDPNSFALHTITSVRQTPATVSSTFRREGQYRYRLESRIHIHVAVVTFSETKTNGSEKVPIFHSTGGTKSQIIWISPVVLLPEVSQVVEWSFVQHLIVKRFHKQSQLGTCFHHRNVSHFTRNVTVRAH